MNNLNCHVEPKRQLRVETSQQIYISPRDIAENAKLNHEIAEELKKQSSMSCQCPTLASRSNKDSLATWILWSSQRMTKIIYLATFALFPSLAQAETCTATPDCKSLGYTQSSCPDGGGVKCPWNTSLMYCGETAPKCTLKACGIGDVLYSDKKCYTCKDRYILPKQVPIGVVFSSGKAVGLVDLTTGITWGGANTLCSNYSIGGVSGWYLPSKDELLVMYNNRSSVVQGFSSAIGGKDFVSYTYWSSSVHTDSTGTNNGYWSVNPVSGNISWGYASVGSSTHVRPVLGF